MALMTLTHLTYKVGSKILLHDINWQVKRGENWCVLGLNGSGKTTLLGVAAGYLPAADGAVSLLGERVQAENRQRLCAQVGLVSDAFFSRYYRWESVWDVVLAGYGGGLGLASGLDLAKLRRAKSLMRSFGLAKLSRKPYGLLSKGEQQKVLLARALLSKPQVLFLDEPCSGLDVLSRMQVLTLFAQLAKEEQVSLVCVTHHFDEVLTIYDQALLLRQGAVHSQGPRQKVLNEENISDFLGYPAQVAVSDEGMLSIAFRPEQIHLSVDFAKQGGDACGLST